MLQTHVVFFYATFISVICILTLKLWSKTKSHLILLDHVQDSIKKAFPTEVLLTL